MGVSAATALLGQRGSVSAAAGQACALCGSSRLRELYRARDWTYGYAGEYALWECQDCRVVALRPPPPGDLETIAALYPPDYAAHLPGPVGRAPARWRQRVRAVALAYALGYPMLRVGGWEWALGRMLAGRIWRRPYPRYRPQGRAIEVGCGRGDYLRTLAALGWQAVGFDASPQAVALARARGCEARRGTLAELAGPAASWDAIVFLDSFEHCHDPVAMLAAARRRLRPGGELLIRFPDFGCLWRRLFGDYWADIAAPRHLFHYTPATLAALVEQHGFAVERVCRQPSADLSRSLRVWRRAHGHGGARMERATRWLDRWLPKGHCLMRARSGP